MYSYGSPHTAAQKQDDQHERTFSSYVRIQVVVLKTYLGRWTIGRSGERGSGISVLPARYDDDDDSFSHQCHWFYNCCHTFVIFFQGKHFWIYEGKLIKHWFCNFFYIKFEQISILCMLCTENQVKQNCQWWEIKVLRAEWNYYMYHY